MKIDLLILNYNGKDLMRAYLPSIINAAETSSHECTVIVVDNQSVDDSVDILKHEFPQVEIYIAKENKVLCSYNEVVETLDSDLVIFLNNDIKVEPDFIDHLVGHFTDSDVLFAAPRLLNFDGTYNGGRSYLKFQYGAIKVEVDKDRAEEDGQTKAISCGAFRRTVFLDLGGFDDLYLPGIWEDVDLCYRALSFGWKGVYEPRSIMWHDESTTFHREYGKKRKMRLAHRNMFLFFWKNITDKKMFLEHILLTPPRMIIKYFTGATEILEGFLLALKEIPKVVAKRKEALGQRKKSGKFSDRELLGKISD